MINEKRGMGKKGQVTAFIIVGILIVIIVGVIFLVSDQGFGKRTLSNTQVEPIRLFLRECITNIVVDSAENLRKYGGDFDNSGGVYLDCNGVDGRERRVIADRVPGIYDPGVYLERRLENHIGREIPRECGLDDFRNEYDISNEDKFEVDVIFRRENIDVTVDFDTFVGKGISSVNLGSIFVSINDDVNEANAIAASMAFDFYTNTAKDITDVLFDVNEGDVSLNNLGINFVDGNFLTSREALGDNCIGRPICEVTCDNGCCIIATEFSEDNGKEDFIFGLNEI